MPRRPRMYIPGYVYHVVQRGNNRQACFFEPENFHVYLKYLREVLPRYGNALHAYCLMTNHVHLLLTPKREDGISNLLKVVCSRYGQYINKKYERTGSLWEGRHKASVVDSERYLLKCYRYIELNPVVAKIVEEPEDYEWSSYRSNACGMENELLSPHAIYLALDSDRNRRLAVYRELVRESLARDDAIAIQNALHHSLPLGSEQFFKRIERIIGRTPGYSQPGRPPLELVKN